MASKAFAAVFLLIALISAVQIQARESQFFNKVPSNNPDRDEAEIVAAADGIIAAGPAASEPNFVPENENGGYGLYGHNAGQNPPATTTNAAESKLGEPKYLPKNYNVNAYVTVPEGYRGAAQENDNKFASSAAEFDNNKNPGFYSSEKDSNYREANLYTNGNYYNKGNNPNSFSDANDSDDSDDSDSDSDEFANTKFYDGQKEANFYSTNNNDENQNPNVRSEPFDSKKGFNLYGNNGAGEKAEEFDSKKGFTMYGNNAGENSFQKQSSSYNGGLEDSKFADATKYNSFDSSNDAGKMNGVQKQGMSDTRFLENGKYFYDVNMEQQQQKFNSRNYNKYNNYYRGQDLP